MIFAIPADYVCALISTVNGTMHMAHMSQIILNIHR